MTTTTRLSMNANFSISKPPNSIDAALNLRLCCLKNVCSFGWKLHSQSCFVHVNSFSRMEWSIRSSVDGSGFDPSSGNGGRPRLIRAIQGIQTKLGVRIQELRKNLPMKILFFLVGFYCATAFATVIGQTGDWDILSAALAVFIVEGIGALMYRASLPLLNNVKSLITMFNYWKAGLSLGLFLDSFKYELDKLTGFSIPSSFDLDVFALFV
ncbi:ycf20-like protein [Hibiscus syriacus]|nr:ycf20-like protein [Hibiscus syriacus]